MKIALQVDQLFLNAPGGIGTYIRNLVPAIAARDPAIEMTLFHARFDSSDLARRWPGRWPRDHRVEELRGTMRSLYPRWNLLGRPALPPSLRSTDLVHVTNHAGVAPAGPGQALIVTVHDLAVQVAPALFPRRWRSTYRLGLRAAVRRADAIVTPSRSTAEDLLSRTGVDPRKLHVVPLAAALPAGALDADEVLARLKIRAPYVLFVGTLEPRKNLVRLVRAYRRVAAEGFPHALVLAGPLGWHHESLMRELALEGPGEIVMTGEIGADELDAVYRAADVFAYPSLYEGFGLPVLEAMARGIPTVASNTSAVAEVAGDAAVGVDPRSVRSIAQGVGSLVSDVGLADRVAARGRAQAERFTWDETARLTIQVYEHVLGGK